MTSLARWRACSSQWRCKGFIFFMNLSDFNSLMAEWWSVSQTSLNKAKNELNEVPDMRKSCIEAMRNLIPSRPDIKFLRSDESFILRFLRARKFDIQEAFALYGRYFEFRQLNPKLFHCFNAAESDIKQALLDGFPGMLPTCDENGRQVMVIYPANWDHERYTLISIYRAILLSLEKQIEKEDVQINGFVIIVDWSEFAFKQSSQINPRILKLMVEGLQDCFPARFAGIHFISQPWYVEAILTVIRPFLKEKAKSKIFVHGNNLTTLHNHISSDYLPAEFGGSGPPYNMQYWADQLIGNDENFSFSDKDIFWHAFDDLPFSKTSPVSNFQDGCQKLDTCINSLDSAAHPSGIVNVVSGQIGSAEVNVHNAVTIGTEQMTVFESRLPQGLYETIKKKVATMDHSRKHVKVGAVKVFDTNLIYARVIGLQVSGRDIDIKDVLGHELAPVPTSMFDDTRDMRIAKSKSTLKKILPS
ncbi:Clavesin-2 [Nymphon striatum]|nr:Clavesin-2 [Nymphon striatum]